MTKMNRVNIGKLLKAARIGKGLSQVYVCDKANISRPTLAGLESGDSNTSIDVLVAVADVIGYRIDVSLVSK